MVTHKTVTIGDITTVVATSDMKTVGIFKSDKTGQAKIKKNWGLKNFGRNTYFHFFF